jgi:hypothetical protein
MTSHLRMRTTVNSIKCVVKGVESLESDDFSGDLEFQEKRRCGKEKVQKYQIDISIQ